MLSISPSILRFSAQERRKLTDDQQDFIKRGRSRGHSNDVIAQSARLTSDKLYTEGHGYPACDNQDLKDELLKGSREIRELADRPELLDS